MSNISEAEDPRTPMGGSQVHRKQLFSWGGDVNGKGALRIGLFALAEDWLADCSQLKPGELVYTDFISEARRISAELKADGAEFIIAVTHCREANDLRLTKEVKDIDLLLGNFTILAEKFLSILFLFQEDTTTTISSTSLSE